MGEQEETSARLTSLAKECHLFITPSLVARPRTTSSHLVQWTQSPFAPEFLVSRQPAHLHTQAESGAYLRAFSRDPRRRPFIHLNRHTPSGQSRYRITQLRTDGVHRRESSGTEPVVSKVVPNGCFLGRPPWTN